MVKTSQDTLPFFCPLSLHAPHNLPSTSFLFLFIMKLCKVSDIKEYHE